ncbi:hypothetical protein BDV06DRAFT_199348 [Aspergillus oleicola]
MATPIPADGSEKFQLVYDAGDCNAVWSLGNSAFCKVHEIIEGMTPEPGSPCLHSRQIAGLRTPKAPPRCGG